MAKVVFDSALTVRGRVSRWVYREVEGQRIVSGMPHHERKRKRSAAEANTNTRFKWATAQARCASPELVARYNERARQEKLTKWSVRVRDALRPPTIPAVYTLGYTGRCGDEILIIARDDFEVKQVRVTLRYAKGPEVETGVATRLRGDLFRYAATATPAAATPLMIEVIAEDWAKNETRWKTEWPAGS